MSTQEAERLVLDEALYQTALATMAATAVKPEPVPEARIQILNWRQHGEDEAYCRLEVFGRGVTGGVKEILIKEAAADERPITFDEDEWNVTGTSLAYVNDDITITNGEILESGGRRFRISITEVF